MSSATLPSVGWRPSEGRPPLCGQTHGRVGGWLDEAARRLPHEELAVARQLVAEGHRVRAVAADGSAPTADLDVCGTAVEVKSFLPPDQRDRLPSSRSVFNKLVQAERQGATVVVYARGSGLTAEAARDGVSAYGDRTHRGRTQAIRVLGDGFDLSWVRGLGLGRGPERGCGPELQL